MRKRILSLILCLALLVTSAPLIMPMVDAAETELTVEHDGAEVNEISLKVTDKKTLTANAEGLDVLSYRWQILADMNTNLWVNINGETDESCNVSLAMVKSLFDSTGAAYVRCVAELPDGELISDPVCVTEIPEADPLDPPHVTALTVSLPLLQESAPDLKIAGSGAVQTLGATETVTITVKYLDFTTMGGEKEAAIYTPHIITIESGGSFSDTVTSPTFLGFAPFCDFNGDGTIDEATESATKVKINETNLKEDKVIKVWYKPVKVPYAIKYYFQNINDDLYLERPELYFVGEAETGTIISNEELQSHAGDTTGFTKLYHIPENVAADGSTTFECYYDRNYYLVQFDLNGGYGVDPIYGRYGTAYIVNDPIRHGWVFKGWDLLTTDSNSDGVLDTGDGVADVMPATIPATNQYYRAIWTTTKTTYDVVYWVQAPNDPASVTPNAIGATLEYLGQREVDAMSDDLVSGSNDIKEHLGSMYSCGKVNHAQHTDECYGNCTESVVHQHNKNCYGLTGYYDLNSNQSQSAQNALNALKGALGANKPINGYVYRYRFGSTTYNFVYVEDTWFYTGMGNVASYGGVEALVDSPNGNGKYNFGQANLKNCSLSEHTHGTACLSCPLEIHTHTDECKVDIDTSHLEYYGADTKVRVEGDGSTVVNVYYRYAKYRLRFIYARTNKNTGVHEVVGGSTYPFGTSNASTNEYTNLATLLNNVSEWGEISVDSPEDLINDEYKNMTVDGAKVITLGTYSGTNYGQYNYYYIEFDARFGQNIEELWPIGMFFAADIVGNHSQTSLKTAYFSAWNGEYKVKYTQDNSWNRDGGRGKKNETIKGCYMYLDENLLYKAGFNYTVNGEGGTVLPEGGTKIVNYLGFWENGDNVSWSIPRLYLYRLQIPKVDGSGYELYRSFETYDNNTPTGDGGLTHQTPSSIEGFTFKEMKLGEWTAEERANLSDGAKLLPDQWALDFFYTRNSYTVRFISKNNNIKTVDAKDFGTSMSMYADGGSDEVEVPYPDTLEENAYYFDGWYTTAACYQGSEFDLSTKTMTPYDLTLYAKWTPKTHVVNFYPSYNDMLAGTNLHATKSVEHGQVAGAVDNPTYVQNGMDLIFAGWFYMDKGVKKAFTPMNMAVNDDMQIFADWSSSQPQPYQISYVLKDNPSVKVADDTKGFAYGGSTRTFVAKAGDPYNQLYSEYNMGYFPTLASHSITMQYEADKDHPVNNVHTFEYVHAANVAYTVRYVNLENNLVMEEYTTTTQKAVETVRFKSFTNMVPDAFYKRLVISVVWDPVSGTYVGSPDNVVTFYYTPNNSKAYYAVHYLTEKLGATATQLTQYKIDGTGGYEMAVAHVEGIGDVNSNVSIAPQIMPGFTHIKTDGVAKTTVGGTNEQTVNLTGDKYNITIKPEGTELYIFYSRNTYSYKVNYYMHNTTDLVDATNFPSKTGTMKYGATLTETAPTIPGYTCVSANKTQSMVIREKVEQNVINFYYAPVEYVTEYIPVVSGSVPDDMAGWLDRNIEVVDGSEIFKGSKPNTIEHYQFDGWFLDEACTVAVGAKATVDADNRILPVKAELSETDSNKFYAKFTKLAGDFTITRTGAADSDQVFVYQVVNKDNGDTIYVTIKGNGSVTIADLVYGEYTVTQMNDWSWRYSDAAVDIEHEDDDPEAEVTFSGGASGKWLSGHSDRKHNVKGG